MNKLILMAILFIVGFIGIIIMKKIDPKNKIYPMYVFIVIICFSIVIFLS